MVTISVQLLAARKAAGREQKESAKAVGMRPSALSKIERGADDAPALKAGQLKALAELYNVSADWLLGLSDRMRPAGGISRDEVRLLVEQVTEEVMRRLTDRRRRTGQDRTG